MSYASFQKKAQEKEVLQLESKIKSLEREHKARKDLASLNELKQTRRALDNLPTERVERSLTFTKHKYYDSGPNALKLLAYKLKKQQKKSYISTLTRIK